MSMIKGLRAATARSPTRKAVTVQTMAAAGLTVSGVSAPGRGVPPPQRRGPLH